MRIRFGGAGTGAYVDYTDTAIPYVTGDSWGYYLSTGPTYVLDNDPDVYFYGMTQSSLDDIVFAACFRARPSRGRVRCDAPLHGQNSSPRNMLRLYYVARGMINECRGETIFRANLNSRLTQGALEGNFHQETSVEVILDCRSILGAPLSDCQRDLIL